MTARHTIVLVLFNIYSIERTYVISPPLYYACIYCDSQLPHFFFGLQKLYGVSKVDERTLFPVLNYQLINVEDIHSILAKA